MWMWSRRAGTQDEAKVLQEKYNAELAVYQGPSRTQHCAGHDPGPMRTRMSCLAIGARGRARFVRYSRSGANLTLVVLMHTGGIP